MAENRREAIGSVRPEGVIALQAGIGFIRIDKTKLGRFHWEEKSCWLYLYPC
jgi:hypothetical protein